jgi:glyoxylase-like metal-dependent hydrolase (beta-lactamase superfamily II)
MESSSIGRDWSAAAHKVTETSLPNQIQVIVRDWLCANHVLLTGRDETVLIDTGYVTRAPHTLALLDEHLRGGRVDVLVNTHCHSDHMGGNAAVQRRYGCRTLVPEGEAALIRAWDEEALWLAYADQQAERFDFDGELHAGAAYRWGELDWRVIPAPGHDPGALVFHCEEARILISGDALWERGFGIVMPDTPGGLDDAQHTLESIAALDIDVVIPGHGQPFTDVRAAIERSLGRVEALRQDPVRQARSVLKAILSFTLLDRGALPLAGLPEYFASVALHRDLNARYFRLAPEQFAELVVTELERAGGARREGGQLFAR